MQAGIDSMKGTILGTFSAEFSRLHELFAKRNQTQQRDREEEEEEELAKKPAPKKKQKVVHKKKDRDVNKGPRR